MPDKAEFYKYIVDYLVLLSVRLGWGLNIFALKSLSDLSNLKPSIVNYALKNQRNIKSSNI